MDKLSMNQHFANHVLSSDAACWLRGAILLHLASGICETTFGPLHPVLDHSLGEGTTNQKGQRGVVCIV